jgi:DNA-nicking Smr family endonuclease
LVITKDRPDPADANMFRSALEGVTPLAPTNRVSRPPPGHRPAQHYATANQLVDTLSDPSADVEALLEFLRPGISRLSLRKLRRGQLPVQDSLDLHGLKSDEARKLLLQFIHDAMQLNMRHVCIIHGKGWQPGGGEGILKIRTRHWLTQCAGVLAFCEAPPGQGGGGAVLVLLKGC